MIQAEDETICELPHFNWWAILHLLPDFIYLRTLVILVCFRSWDWVARRLLSFHALRMIEIKKKKCVHVQTTTKVRVPERIKNRKHLQRVTSQVVIVNLPLAGVHSGVAQRRRSPHDVGGSAYESNLTFPQKTSSRSRQHQLWWSWSCPLGSVPQGRWLWFQPACDWRSARAWSGSVCREKKRNSALADFCPDCKQILLSD